MTDKYFDKNIVEEIGFRLDESHNDIKNSIDLFDRLVYVPNKEIVEAIQGEVLDGIEHLLKTYETLNELLSMIKGREEGVLQNDRKRRIV